MVRMRRMWVNQPSTLQPDHKYNGLLVLADESAIKRGEAYIDVYLIAGDVVSMRIAVLSLSNGWPEYYRKECR